MKKALLAFLLLGVAVHAPWRLAALVAETLVVQPGLTRVSDSGDKYWDCLALEARLIEMGWQVSYPPDLMMGQSAAYGLTNPMDHTIRIDESLSWNARYAVLAHEGGHVMSRGWLTRNQGEAFAESVAALVAHDGLREHARYMSAFRSDAVLVLLVEWRAIYRAAGVLEDK